MSEAEDLDDRVGSTRPSDRRGLTERPKCDVASPSRPGRKHHRYLVVAGESVAGNERKPDLCLWGLASDVIQIAGQVGIGEICCRGNLGLVLIVPQPHNQAAKILRSPIRWASRPSTP